MLGSLSSDAHDRLLLDAAADLDLFSKAVWRDLSEIIAQNHDKAALDEPLSAIAPLHASRGRSIVVTDEQDRVAATWPQLQGASATLLDMLGEQSQGVGERSGPVRIVLSDGTPALAIIRKLPAPFGRIAAIQPQSWSDGLAGRVGTSQAPSRRHSSRSPHHHACSVPSGAAPPGRGGNQPPHQEPAGDGALARALRPWDWDIEEAPPLVGLDA